MHRPDFDLPHVEAAGATEEELVIDLESDGFAVREEAEADHLSSVIFSDDQIRRIDNAELDSTIDELVDVLNGRDLDGLTALLAPEAEAGFLGESSQDGIVDGFNDLFLRYPTLLVTRGESGPDPIVAVWIFDREADRFDPFGYMTFETSDDETGLIQRIEYIDELSDADDLVVETPERSELGEWEDWSELDED
ncbi:MAG TPA: hypothetical protein VE569_14585 [Acidimicrobiia bacterium]|nr:hypothetical protein [Acidimicrobiia bacterium]